MNVQVAVRCRPLSSGEKTVSSRAPSVASLTNAPNELAQRGAKTCVQISGNAVHVTAPEEAGENELSKKRDFAFDKAYYVDSTQLQVYQDLGQPIIQKALEGYNGTASSSQSGARG